MTAQKTYSGINLVPKDDFEDSLVGKILRWALTTGRLIVVLTEFVVILAFLSRFKLDRDLNDINEIITQKSALVDSFQETETTMRELQARMKVLKNIHDSTVNSQKSFATLMGITPKDIFFDTVEFNRDSWRLVGISGSEVSFANLLAQLQSLKIFAKLQVADIQYNIRRGGTTFTIMGYFPVKPQSITSAAPGTNPTPAAKQEQL